MKMKLILVGMAALCCTCWCAPSVAQNPPQVASADVYDFSKFTDEVLLNLFVNAINDGRKCPTPQEFEAAGFGSELGFVRSHVRPRSVMIDKKKQLIGSLYEKRGLWMNTPTGIGSTVGGYPNGSFHDDVYSMWNYTKLYGCWNHGLFQAPASWVDTGHKNGTDMFSGIKFFESWGSGDGSYVSFITSKNPDGTFKYAKAFIYCLMYFGSDGINYNWEDNSFANEDVVAFHKELYKIAAQEGFTNFHIGIYTSNSTLTSRYADALYGTKSTGKTVDLMLNYSGGDFSYGIQSSVQTAESSYGNADDLYTGVWIVTMDRRWSALQESEEAKRCGVCLWGEHGQSRFMSYNAGNTTMELQDNYQKLLERGFSGGYRNPAHRPSVSNTGNNWEQSGTKEPLSTFCGIASFIPERTAIQGNLPFITYFSLGNGERYNYKGIKTFGSWYNMGAQDVVPTYRWLVYDAASTNVSTAIQPSFTHNDAYIGGSALLLKGSVTPAGTDVILYRTKLTVAGTRPVAKIALKQNIDESWPTNLKLILKKFDSKEWLEFPLGNTAGTNWEEKNIPLTGMAQNDVIEYIGFRIEGESADDYSMMVGKLELSDGTSAKPAPIKENSFTVEVKEETTQSLSVKLNWEVDATGLSLTRSAWNLLYNDEANIDHFEIMYKNGENGKMREIARTTTWSDFIGNILFEDSSDQPYLGVRSASIDGDTYSPIQWVKVERSTSPDLPVYHNNSYGETYINASAEGTDIARKQRYLTKFETSGADQNINYTATAPQADGTQYVDASSNYVMKVHQGQTITINFTAYDASDGLKWCYGKAYMDLNQSFSFEPDGDELVFNLGTTRASTPEFQTGCTVSFKVPADAAPGKSRLRIVFSDAWFSHPGPTGGTAKGFSIDFGVVITGDNQARPTPIDLHDQGEVAEPDRARDDDPTIPSGISTVEKGGFSTLWPAVATDEVKFADVEKAWVYSTSGRMVKFVKGNPRSMNVADLGTGVYVVKMQYNNVIRTQKFVKR